MPVCWLRAVLTERHQRLAAMENELVSRFVLAALPLSLLSASCVSPGDSSASSASDGLYNSANARLERDLSEIVAFRHDIHRYPEVSGQERETSRKVAEQLLALGWEVRTGVGGYGVVGVLKGAIDGPTIAFRADMDAVYSDAPDPVAYASVVEGVRHICGHDLHTAVGVGLAASLTEIRDRLPGTVMLVFQPAEEAGTGARAMLADGLFDKLKPDAILALHTAPLDVGAVSSMPDGMMAGRALVEIELSGESDLESAIDEYKAALAGVATVTGAAMLMPTAESFIGLDIAPASIDAKAGSARLSAFVMSAQLDQRVTVREKVMRALDAVERPDVKAEVSYSQALEGVNNDPSVLRIADRGIAERAPDISVVPMPGVYPAFSEDYGSMQQEVPGVMYFLGVNNPQKGTVGFPHSPNYVADDGAIEVGVKAMLAAMLELMGEPKTTSS